MFEQRQFGVENRAERRPATFSQLYEHIRSVEASRRPSPELLIQAVQEQVLKAMPYDLEWVGKHDEGFLEEVGLDGITDTAKVSLTAYLNERGGKGVCRNQALLACLIIEKLIDNKLFPPGTKVQNSSNVAYMNDEEFGHAWCTITVPDTKTNKERRFILDAAHQVFGELITDKNGSYVGSRKCNSGLKGTKWKNEGLWPYDAFDYSGTPNNNYDDRKGPYTAIMKVLDKKFVNAEERHQITRNSRIDKGFGWPGSGLPAVVVDWDKYYENGYRQIEEKLVASISDKLNGQIPIQKKEMPVQRNDESLSELENRVARATSFSDLYIILRNISHVRGSVQTFTGADLTRLIKEVESGTKDTDSITSTLGLRDKAEELLTKRRR